MHQVPSLAVNPVTGNQLVADERPRPLPPLPTITQQAKPISWEIFTEHPGFGLSPDAVWNIFCTAEAGYPQGQVDLFEDLLENDGHLRGLFLARSHAVAGKSWVLQPAADDSESKECAQALEEALKAGECNTQEMLEHQLDSVAFGYAGSEIEWDFRDGKFYPCWFHNIAHRRWVFDKFGHLRILTKLNDYLGQEPEPGNWVLSKMRHTNPARAGLMRTATWFAMFKRFAVRDWVIKAEKFGIPPVIGFYNEGAAPDSIDALKQAQSNLGEGGQATLSNMTRLEFPNIGRDGGDISALNPSIAAFCDQQNSKVVTGGTLTSDTGGVGTGGSYALANVHADVRFDIVLWDAIRLSRSFGNVASPFVKFNGYKCKPPRLKLQISQELNQKTRAEVFALAQTMGFGVSQEQLAEELALQISSTPLTAPQPAAKDPIAAQP